MNDLLHPCERWAEPISLAAAGCLPADDERDVRQHIETCSVCRARFRELTQLCGALAELPLSEDGAEAAIIERVMSAIASDQSQRPLVRTRAEMLQPAFLARSSTKWRWIMRHPVSSATTAAIFVLAVTGVALWFHGNGATPAFADFVKPILEARTVKYKVTTKWTSLSAEMKSQLPADTQQNFLNGLTSEVMMLDAKRMRTESEDPDKKSKTVHIWDGRQGKSLSLLPAQKRATVSNDAHNHKHKTPNGGDPVAKWRSMLLDAQSKPDVKRESLGEKDIDGRRVVGFRISSREAVFSVWGDPKTGLPARVEMTTAMAPSIEFTISDFEFNADMDESLFSVEPPAGYEIGLYFIANPTIDGSTTKEKDLIETFRQYSKMSGGPFPAKLDIEAITGIIYMEFSTERLQEPGAEQDLIDALREYGNLVGDVFPDSLDLTAMMKMYGRILTKQVFWEMCIPKERRRMEDMLEKATDLQKCGPEKGKSKEEKSQKLDEQFYNLVDWEKVAPGKKNLSKDEKKEFMNAYVQKFMEPHKATIVGATMRIQPGLMFVSQLPPEADAHYAGKGVSLGATDKPIFWYRPKDAKKYRVLYADLSVRDADTPPNVPNSQPLPTPSSPKK